MENDVPHYQPERAGFWPSLIARVATGAGMLIAVGLAVTAFAPAGPVAAAMSNFLPAFAPLGAEAGGFLASNLSASALLGAVSYSGWKSAGTSTDIRDYYYEREAALKRAKKAGTPPVLPPNPMVNPDKQPSRLASGLARFGGGAFTAAGLLFGVAALTSGAAFVAPAAFWFVVGQSIKKAGVVAADSADWAEHEAIQAMPADEDTPRPLSRIEKREAAKDYQFDHVASHPAKNRSSGISFKEQIRADQREEALEASASL